MKETTVSILIDGKYTFLGVAKEIDLPLPAGYYRIDEDLSDSDTIIFNTLNPVQI